jgi:AcrR family transcriptional regulator
MSADRRKERADAARNRRAILAATEELLAAHRAMDISMEQVAAAAGVGKGTIFHRFGSRTGLMRALMHERAQALSDALSAGPPPLGPGAPDRDRLFAFLDAVLDLVGRNKSLLAELSYAAAAETPPEKAASGEPAQGNDADKPAVYPLWHAHLTALLAAQRPDIDAGLTAHLLLGALHSEPILARLTADGPGAGVAAVATALRAMVRSILDAPSVPDGTSRASAGT